MEKQSFVSQIDITREHTQSAIESLNSTLEMPEAKTLTYKNHQLLQNTRRSLKRNLARLSKVLLAIDAISHPVKLLPGFTAEPDKIPQYSQEITKFDNAPSTGSS
ncbi:hypothetical protein ES705_19298 [subsurface metagenome]